MIKICKWCGKKYKTKYKKSKFCSRNCTNEWQRKGRIYKQKIVLRCNNCNKIFHVTPQYKNKKFCSKKCYIKYSKKTQIKLKCKNCGKIFYVSPRSKNQIFCSKKCYLKNICKSIIVKTCIGCGNKFNSKNIKQKYCSIKCYHKYYKHSNKILKKLRLSAINNPNIKKYKKGNVPWIKGKHHTNKIKEQIRINFSKYLKENIINNKYINIGKNEKEILDNVEKINHIKLKRQHYVNGYFVDGYDSINNICYEVDEKNHLYGDNPKKDKIRQNRITQKLKCEFIRIKDYKNSIYWTIY